MTPGVAHKSDAGLVVLGVPDRDRCEAEATRLLANGSARLLVQPVVKGDTEALLGVVTEPGLGRFVVFGLGGIYTEALADTTLLPCAATRDEIADALTRSRLGAVLASTRGANKKAFEQMLAAIAALAAFANATDDRLQAIDVNPVLVTDADVLGVDALIVLS